MPPVAKIQGLENAANVIRKLVDMGPNPTQVTDPGHRALIRRPGRKDPYAMLEVRVHMGDVLYGLSNLGFAINKAGTEAILARAPELLYAIREFTPQGPEVRDISARLNDYYAKPADPLRPSNMHSYRVWARDGLAAMKAVERQEGESFDPHDNVMMEMAFKTITQGYKGVGRYKFSYGGGKYATGDFGSLWSSITVDGISSPNSGDVALQAYSRNYYAGYVNDGFEHGLVPIMRQERIPKTSRLDHRNRTLYATLRIARLAHYPIWDIKREASVTDVTTGTTRDVLRGFAYNRLDSYSELADPVEAGSLVDFAPRKNSKHQEGAHMFELGTELFLNGVMPKFRNDLDRIMAQAWNRGVRWDNIARQQRVRKGFKGGNRPGTFAGFAIPKRRKKGSG